MSWQRYSGAATSLAVGLMVGGLVFAHVRALEPGVAVAVAAVDLAPGDVVGPGQVRVVRLPRLAVHPEAYRRVEDVRDREVATFVRAGEQLLPSKFTGGLGPGGSGGLLLYVPLPAPGYPEGFVHPGAAVSLLVVAGGREEPPVARLAGAGVRVVGVDRERTGARSGGRIVGLVVEVDEREAAGLLEALASGQVQVLPRWGGPSSGPGGGRP